MNGPPSTDRRNFFHLSVRISKRPLTKRNRKFENAVLTLKKSEWSEGVSTNIFFKLFVALRASSGVREMSMGTDTTWVGKKPLRRIGGMSDALAIAADLGFSVSAPPTQVPPDSSLGVFSL